MVVGINRKSTEGEILQKAPGKCGVLGLFQPLIVLDDSSLIPAPMELGQHWPLRP